MKILKISLRKYANRLSKKIIFINIFQCLEPALLFLVYEDTLGQGRAKVPFEFGLQGLSYV